ncbi:hypothetical protein [Paraburkholderia aromaticivorans]|nr:hypothetical protein [Paraburkholderia aromaticivorans]
MNPQPSTTSRLLLTVIVLSATGMSEIAGKRYKCHDNDLTME